MSNPISPSITANPDSESAAPEPVTVHGEYSDPGALLRADRSLNHMLESIQLVIDPEKRGVRARTESHDVNTVPTSVHNRRVFRISATEDVDASRLANWLRAPERQRLLARICDGYDTDWDGQNIVGRFDADAREAYSKLSDLLQSGVPTHSFRVWTPDRWLGDTHAVDLGLHDESDISRVVDEVKTEAREKGDYLIGSVEAAVETRYVDS